MMSMIKIMISKRKWSCGLRAPSNLILAAPLIICAGGLVKLLPLRDWKTAFCMILLKRELIILRASSDLSF